MSKLEAQKVPETRVKHSFKEYPGDGGAEDDGYCVEEI